MQHSPCAEWVWLLDADAFVMNLTASVGRVIDDAVSVAQAEGRPAPDVIVAKDVNVRHIIKERHRGLKLSNKRDKENTFLTT